MARQNKDLQTNKGKTEKDPSFSVTLNCKWTWCLCGRETAWKDQLAGAPTVGRGPVCSRDSTGRLWSLPAARKPHVLSRLCGTGCPTKPYPLCIWVIVNCKIVQFPHKTIHFKADVLRTKTSTHSFLRYK